MFLLLQCQRADVNVNTVATAEGDRNVKSFAKLNLLAVLDSRSVIVNVVSIHPEGTSMSMYQIQGKPIQ